MDHRSSGAGFEHYGCDNDASGYDICSSSTVLTDDDFTYGATSYDIEAVEFRTPIGAGNSQLAVDLGTA